MQMLHKADITYFKGSLLDQEGLIEHAFSSRLGGCSSGFLTSLNMAYHTADTVENILENRKRFFKIFDQDHREVIGVTQVHGSLIEYFSEPDRGEGALPGTLKRHCDALLTTESNLCLTAFSADCLLLYFVLPSLPLVAIAHAGRQGTLEGIAGKMVEEICRRFQGDPAEIIVQLSPSICKSCYTINNEQAEQFLQAGWRDNEYLTSLTDQHFQLDLAAINIAQLRQAGVADQNIGHSALCTSCRPDLFYSYRRDQGQTGRMIGFIKINKQAGG